MWPIANCRPGAHHSTSGRPIFFFFSYMGQAQPAFSFFSFLRSNFVLKKKTAAARPAEPTYAFRAMRRAFFISFFKFHLRTYMFSSTLPSLWPLNLFFIYKYRPIEPPKIIRLGLNQYFGLTRFLKDKYFSPLRRNFWELSPLSKVIFSMPYKGNFFFSFYTSVVYYF